jgi:hypothetical protein
MEEGVLPVGHTIAPDFITTQKVVSPRIDLPKEGCPE